MAKEIITAKRVYNNVSKQGKKYLKILATNGEYYVSWQTSSITGEIKEGTGISLESKPGKMEGYKDIVRIISIDARNDTLDVNSSTISSTVKGSGVSKPPTPSTMSIVEQNVRAKLKMAVSIMGDQFGLEDIGVNPDSVVLAEVLHQLISEVWLLKDEKVRK